MSSKLIRYIIRKDNVKYLNNSGNWTRDTAKARWFITRAEALDIAREDEQVLKIGVDITVTWED